MLHYIRAHRVQLGRPPGPIPPPIFAIPRFSEHIATEETTLIHSVLSGVCTSVLSA
jgi:hypothetical protein